MRMQGIIAAALMSLMAVGIHMEERPGSISFRPSGGAHAGRGQFSGKRQKVKRWKQPMRQHGRRK